MFFHGKLSGGEHDPRPPHPTPPPPQEPPTGPQNSELPSGPAKAPDLPWERSPLDCPQDQMTGRPGQERSEAGPRVRPGRALFIHRGRRRPQPPGSSPAVPTARPGRLRTQDAHPCSLPSAQDAETPSLAFPEGRLRRLELIRL